jgi:hypothetical protein
MPGAGTLPKTVYADTQACVNDFRQYCLDNNLLDFSLQLEVFSKTYWSEATLREYLHRTYRNIIYDNIEEDVPIAHDILKDWLPELDSALLIFDQMRVTDGSWGRMQLQLRTWLKIAISPFRLTNPMLSMMISRIWL